MVQDQMIATREVPEFEWDLGDVATDDREFPVLLCTDYT